MSHSKKSSPTRSAARTRVPASSAQPDSLQENDVSFRVLFMNNPQPMWVYDLKTLFFLEVNQAAEAHYGYTRDEFLRMRTTDICPQEDIPRFLKNVGGTKIGLNFSGNWRHLLKNGRLIDVEAVSYALMFKGKETGLVVVRDVTQRKQAEAALKHAEKKYRQIFEEAIVGIFQSTPDGRLLSVNPAMAHTFGYDSPEELMTTVHDIPRQLYVDPARRDEFKRLVHEQGVVRHFEVQFYRKDGSKMWLSANARAVREGDTVVRYDGTFEDITDRKLLEDQLRQAQKMEAVGRLAGGVAHDFNNALGVITGYSDLLQTRLPAGDDLHRYAEEIAKAGHRAAVLTRQLLAFSRKQVIQPVLLDLNTSTAELENMLRRLIGEDIQIHFTRDPDLGRVKVDPGQIEQILMNLAVNSRDAMPHGGKLCIETANVELDETYARQNAFVIPGSYVMLSVSDTGCGIDKATQAQIFEPFFTTKESGKGTGLGLSTVYGIVKQNEGYILVYSEVGKGTTFRIYLPRVGDVAEPSSVSHVSTVPARGTETVLLVEDEEPLRTLARTCLEGNGYTVLEASNSLKAFELAATYKGHIHLLLTDVVMPGVSGRELVSLLSSVRPGIRVLYMSGYTNDVVAQHGVLDREILLLEKPFTLHGLLTKVHEALHTEVGKKAATAT